MTEPRQASPGRPGEQIPPPAGHKRGGARYLPVKRALDAFLACIGLVVLAPLMAAAAGAVKASSPGPVLFRQARVGRNGHSFMILKFRSMRMGSGGPLVTAGGDSRITRVGRLLRRSKVDELPQLWNVLVGDMSIVGPRPEVRRYVDLYPEDYRHILAVRPGITDFAALEYRNEEAVLAGYPDPDAAYIDVVLPAKIALYHRYLNEMSLGTDLALILRTLGKLIR